MAEAENLRSEDDYHAALRELEKVWGADPGSAADDRLNLLVDLIVSYEDRHHPMSSPSRDAIATFLSDEENASADARYRFRLYQDHAGDFVFSLRAPNGDPLFHSSPFRSREEALSAIKALQSLQHHSSVIEEAA